MVQECTDAFEPDSWALLSADGQLVLTTLLSSVHAPRVRLMTRKHLLGRVLQTTPKVRSHPLMYVDHASSTVCAVPCFHAHIIMFVTALSAL